MSKSYDYVKVRNRFKLSIDINRSSSKLNLISNASISFPPKQSHNLTYYYSQCKQGVGGEGE